MATNKTIKTLLIDNYDSYTFNLYQYLAQVNGEDPDVIFNDQVKAEEILQRIYDGKYDNIVISPGPGLPSKEQDFGICDAIIRKANIPILGVCLGHQGIALAHGAKLARSTRIIHGQVSTITHNGDSLFKNIPTSFEAVRYHSWFVQNDLPASLEAVAWCTETDAADQQKKVIMAIKHTILPVWGVQFHPESICTQYGLTMLRNFAELSRRIGSTPLPIIPRPIRTNSALVKHVKISVKILARNSHVLFDSLFGALDDTIVEKFWLDSSRAEPGLSRFSYMGAATGPHAASIAYQLDTRTVDLSTRAQNSSFKLTDNEDFFTYIRSYLKEKGYFNDDSLPFDLQTGLVGYIGYEMKRETLASNETERQYLSNTLPDANIIFADRLVVIDHQQNEIYVLAYFTAEELSSKENMDWMDDTTALIKQLDHSLAVPVISSTVDVVPSTLFKIELKTDYTTYCDQIKQCLNEIEQGETYELCLTNQLQIRGVHIKPLDFHKALRDINPAPYASFLSFKTHAVVCSSPEKFLSIDRNGLVESKPIKGTIKRGNTVAEDEMLRQKLQQSKKDFAENLMIVDLIRNDLGRVCQIGSITVPKLMDIESYATVHQLVTTVHGQLNTDKDVIDCFTSAFPPGSMTGAPKLRSTQILEQLEARPRGIYSGTIGFISLNDTCHFNVVIRTAVFNNITDDNFVAIGCGGAIVMQSDIEEEFQEVLLKGSALVNTLAKYSAVIPRDIKIIGIPHEKITIGAQTKFDGVKFLEDLSTKSGVLDLSLDRIKKFLAILGQPQEKVPMIHVTGTNGKGSVCAYISSVLIEKGLKVGRFTSPHLIRWQESIQINNEDVTDDDFNEVLREVSNTMTEHNAPLTQFEAITVAAYLYFYKSRCDVNVIEVGMGGRDDATNVCSSPLVSVITSIGLDHVLFLGNTHAKIAYAKAGIVKQDRPCVIPFNLVAEAKETIVQYASQLHAPVHIVKAPAVMKSVEDQIAEFEGLTYRLPLMGEHQLTNSALSITALRLLKQVSPNPKFHVTDEEISDGMYRVRWPARLQFIVWNNKRVLIDGAHNEEGGRALRQFINTLQTRDRRALRINWIIGMLSSKDHTQFFKEVLAPNDSLCVVPVSPNVDWLFTADPTVVAEKAKSVRSQLTHCIEEATVFSALDRMTASTDSDDFSDETDRLIVVSGSLHLCGNVLTKTEQFSLLETMLFDPHTSEPNTHQIVLFSFHLKRLLTSARYFNVPVNEKKIVRQLATLKEQWTSPMRIRLLIHPHRNNEVEIQATPATHAFDQYPPSILRLAAEAASKRNIYLYHKTTQRTVYEQARRSQSDCDDVIMHNEEREVTETTIGNIAVRLKNDDTWFTPPIKCGVLPGCMREQMLANGELTERIIHVDELAAVEEIKLFNSVRGRWTGLLKPESD